MTRYSLKLIFMRLAFSIVFIKLYASVRKIIATRIGNCYAISKKTWIFLCYKIIKIIDVSFSQILRGKIESVWQFFLF